MNKMKSDKLIMGILAHVDAGKTTMAESLLYLTGGIRKLGRVDHKDTFLDTYELERARGITIFSKQAQLKIQDKDITLLDTPGHVDFSAEMERTLQVLDYVILIISGADGVQGHVETLWKLLNRYQIPVFLFINKMDQQGTDKEALLTELQSRLSENCVDFSGVRNAANTNAFAQVEKTEPCQSEKLKNNDEIVEGAEELLETLAMCDEQVMEHYLNEGTITIGQTKKLIKERKVFPCYFGSALKIQGVEEFMQGLSLYTEYKEYPEDFGARIFKISRDAQGNRLTHMKIMGGTLKVKTLLSGQENTWQEKADQLRIYSGSGYELQQEVSAGSICAVTGLTKTFTGEGLGAEENVNLPLLEPVLNYRIILPEECNVHTMLLQLRQLEEEEPLLHIIWKEEVGEIHAQLMGEVQIEVLKALIKERFGVEVEFGSGSIVYKETLLEAVEGVGHYEPLRHYAEVHLLMEPGREGSGLQFAAACSEDVLDRNWQRLILTHLAEKKHKGVLTGSEITDMKITLIAGKAHLKHTEGGDFRQSTYRAVRQGLKMGKSRLLEPIYEFRLEVPSEMVGRAMTDIQNMHGNFTNPELMGNFSVLTGTAPVATMQGYQREVLSYTKGQGHIFCSLKGYAPCHNEEEVIAAIGYDSERDLENPTGSVFCSHGAGFVVEYDKVYEYMHLEGMLATKTPEPEEEQKYFSGSGRSYTPGVYNQDELDAIFKRTYGDIKQERAGWKKTTAHKESRTTEYGTSKGNRSTSHSYRQEKEYLLVDGYNIIFGWEELKELAKTDIGAARGKLMDLLSNYQGYKKNIVILVFDAYKVEGNPGSNQKYHNIHVVYTKEAETADQYIEKVTHELGKKYRVTVATSDALEQVIILGQGAQRMSAKGLFEEIEAVNVEIRQELQEQQPVKNKNYLFSNLSEDMAQEMEAVRLGKKKE